MTRKFFLKNLGAIAAGAALAVSGLGGVGKAVGSTLFQPGRLLRAGQRRFSILYALNRIGAMTPDQLDRALFESGLSEQFDLTSELASMVEEGVLRQTVSADGIIYKISDSYEGDIANTGDLGRRQMTEIDAILDESKARFLAERDYLAQYTESSTGVVPIFLSIREGARILFKVNIIVADVEMAKVVCRNWMKNAHKTHRAVWDSIGEGLPFPSFESLREVR